MSLAVLQTGLALLFVSVASWFAVGRLINRLIAKDIVDRPNDRTLHQGAIPRGGGLVIVASIILALGVMTVISSRPQLFSCLGVLTLAWASLSWWDDKHELSPRFRLLTQLLISIISVAALGWVNHIEGFSLWWFGPVLSVMGLVWMANLYNFMDGMDGLAASQTIVASITLGFWFLALGDVELALVCAVLAASTYGFLLWNWNPAKIFMGDVGSVSLGAFFATLFIVGVTRYDISIISFLGLFGVFIADSTVTILTRAARKEKIWLPHKQHFYQRLANAGYSHVNIAMSCVGLMLICSVFATLGLIYHDMIILSLVAIIATLLAAAILVICLEKRAKY